MVHLVGHELSNVSFFPNQLPVLGDAKLELFAVNRDVNVVDDAVTITLLFDLSECRAGGGLVDGFAHGGGKLIDSQQPSSDIFIRVARARNEQMPPEKEKRNSS